MSRLVQIAVLPRQQEDLDYILEIALEKENFVKMELVIGESASDLLMQDENR